MRGSSFLEDKASLKQEGFSIERLSANPLANPGKKISEGDSLPDAAVCLILKSDGPSLLMIKRRELEGDPWSGHMAFPGGHYAETDKELLATVIREVLEEVNIDLRKQSMLGTLDELLPGNRLIRVTPFVALAGEPTVVKINEREVADYFWIPISFFLDPSNCSTFAPERSGAKFSFPCYMYGGKYAIWGLSFRIIQDLLAKERG